ncbi:site-2 protease family protein [Patescibacteria group bacterium]|nr:site-2 protease family protein [Patescibacteria group bacterium]
MQFLIFGAMISLSLAVFNILPIPALDGGRLL